MVVVVAPQDIDVDRGPSRDGQRLQHMRDVFAGQLAKPHAPQTEIHLRPGPAREIHHGPRQRLIQRRAGRAESGDARAVAERVIERCSDGQRAIFSGVVVVHLEVSLALKPQVPPGVERKR